MRTLLVTLASIATGFALPHGDPTQEPPLHFDVNIDGTTHRVSQGKKTSIKIGDTEHQVTIAVAPHRYFNAGGISFGYPRDTLFEYEPDGATQSWTLGTNNLTFIVHRFDIPGGSNMAKMMIDATISSFEVEAEVKPRSLKFGTETYQGLGATLTMGDSDLDIAMFDLTIDGESVVITVQNMLDDDGKVAPDSTAAMKAIQKSFRLTGK